MRHASALKAKRQNINHREQNFEVRNRVRTLTKSVLSAIAEKNVDKAKTQFKIAQSAWKKAANRNIFHQNAANRQVSRLANRIALLAKG